VTKAKPGRGYLARQRESFIQARRPPPADPFALACVGAECVSCPRRKYINEAQFGSRGPKYAAGGLMVIAMPDQWSGKPLRVLVAVLQAANIDPDEVYFAEPMACPDGDVITEQQISESIFSCLGRLEYEISAARPGVIVVMGNEALHALTGHTRERMVTERFACALCGDGPRSKKCAECGGRKTRGSVAKEYVTDHRVSWVAGATFTPAEAASPSWLADYGVRYVVSTFTPSALLVKAETAAQAHIGGQFIANTFVAHLAKARRLLTEDRDWALEVTVTDLVEDVEEYTRDAALPYAVDIETDAKAPYDVTTIKCIGIGRADRAEVLVVDTSRSEPTDPLVLAVKAFLEDPTKAKIFQNRQYDELVCELRWNAVTAGTVFDTMLAHHALAPDEPHNLQRIALTYTDAPAWKPPKNRNGMEAFENDEEFWTYNARDVRATALAHRAMATTLRAEAVAQVHTHDLRMATIAMEMQRVGIPLDAAARDALGVQYRQQADDALAEMRDYLRAWHVPEAEEYPVSDHSLFNPDSPKQLGWALFSAGGPCNLTPHVYSEKTDQPSTSRDAVRPHASHPFVQMLLRYRDARKIIGTYIDSDGLRLAADGRIHPSWKVHGTVTGRWSSSPNLQNWPAVMRSIVKPAPGFVLIGADYSQLELRIIAALAGDPTLIRLCMEADESDKTNPDKDPHSYVAALAFGRVFLASDPKGRKALRDGTKSVVYGMNYGAGPKTILSTIMGNEDYKGPPLTIDMVERIMGAYFQGFPRVKEYRDGALERASAKRAVVSPLLGRRRPFPLGDVDATVAMNFPIQSCAADLMNESLDVLYKALPSVDPDAVILAQVHDAVYVEAREEHAAAVATLIEKSLTRTLRLVANAPEMLFVASAKIGTSWDKVS
jgi:DNA polymerase I-like protein with 3'-5' exonuclease and polymerase domains